MKCAWCEYENAKQGKNTVFWELPDGTRTIEINQTPCIICPECEMEYQEDVTVEEIEDQLVLIDTKKLDNQISFESLMAIPRFLKKNYFR